MSTNEYMCKWHNLFITKIVKSNKYYENKYNFVRWHFRSYFISFWCLFIWYLHKTARAFAFLPFLCQLIFILKTSNLMNLYKIIIWQRVSYWKIKRNSRNKKQWEHNQTKSFSICIHFIYTFMILYMFFQRL